MVEIKLSKKDYEESNARISLGKLELNFSTRQLKTNEGKWEDVEGEKVLAVWQNGRPISFLNELEIMRLMKALNELPLQNLKIKAKELYDKEGTEIFS